MWALFLRRGLEVGWFVLTEVSVPGWVGCLILGLTERPAWLSRKAVPAPKSAFSGASGDVLASLCSFVFLSGVLRTWVE